MISVDEYLTTAYRPDCDYVNGIVEERNVGQKDHAKLQFRIPNWFWMRGKSLGLLALPDWRLRVAQDRYRVPDVCVVALPEPEGPVLVDPPYIVIEILSPDDTLGKLQERLDDYLAIGVENIWVINPDNKRGWQASVQGLFERHDGVFRTTDSRVAMPLADLFSAEHFMA